VKKTIVIPDNIDDTICRVRGEVIAQTKQNISYSAVVVALLTKAIEGGKDGLEATSTDNKK